jgi:hypothetical protein
MPEGKYNGRRAVTLENAHLHVTVLPGGGHIAAIVDKRTGVNPLWSPPWNSVEPTAFDPGFHPVKQHPEFGTGSDARLLAGIMGHNLCLDLFGGPSAEEEAAGMTAHGEGSVVSYDVAESGGRLTMKALFPLAQIRFERRLELHGNALRIRESAESLAAFDRPVCWTQHVTLGPPFLENGRTQFRSSATKSKVFETEFGTDAYLKTGAEFEWPLGPGKDGTYKDLRVMNLAAKSSAYTAHALDSAREHAFFTAWSPSTNMSFGYIWKRADFPWLGIWEENHSRQGSPWNGKALTRGMEFGVSPFPESRKDAVARGSLFGVPTYRRLPARTTLQAEYWATLQANGEPLESLAWPK